MRNYDYSLALTKWLSLVVLCTSVILLGLGIWLYNTQESACLKFLQGPVVVIGVCLFLVSFCGFVGSAYAITWLLWVYACLLLIGSILLFIFMVFSFVITGGINGHKIPGKDYLEHRVGDYSNWLQDTVENRWSGIQSCVMDKNFCSHLATMYPTVSALQGSYLKPLQSGCCMPPASCGYQALNSSFWDLSKGAPSTAPQDCQRYKNSEDACRMCDSCKAGFMKIVRDDWRVGAELMLAALVILVVAYTCGCCALHQAHWNAGYTRRIDI